MKEMTEGPTKSIIALCTEEPFATNNSPEGLLPIYMVAGWIR
jgi:hypothetical protein